MRSKIIVYVGPSTRSLGLYQTIAENNLIDSISKGISAKFHVKTINAPYALFLDPRKRKTLPPWDLLIIDSSDNHYSFDHALDCARVKREELMLFLNEVGDEAKLKEELPHTIILNLKRTPAIKVKELIFRLLGLSEMDTKKEVRKREAVFN